MKQYPRRLKAGCALAALGLLTAAIAGWALYQVPVVNYRAQVLQALGNADEARREFEIALGYNPNFEPACIALGN